jgi:hypothetical protein
MRSGLFLRYPRSIRLGPFKIHVRLAWWRVLLALQINSDDGMVMSDRLRIIARIFFPWAWLAPFKLRVLIVQAVFKIIFDENSRAPSGPRYMDFEQDAPLISAAFMQAYGIDLDKSNMHWFRFRGLLEAMPDDTTFSKVVELRRRPLPKPTKYNAEEIAALQKAKAAVALNVSEEERRAWFASSLKNSTVLRG